MIKTIDGTQTKRFTGIGDRQPLLGGRKLRAIYTSVSEIGFPPEDLLTVI